MVSQKPEILNQTSHSLQRTLASEDVWTEGCTVGHIVTLYSFHDEMFSMLCFVVVCLYVFLFGGEGVTEKLPSPLLSLDINQNYTPKHYLLTRTLQKSLH